MKKNINFDEVADIYDFYVNFELICGTGRVSIPLLKAEEKCSVLTILKAFLTRLH